MEFCLENPFLCSSQVYPRQQQDDDGEETLCSLFLMEKDHMPCADYVTSLKNGDFDVSIRRDTISSISQLSSGFGPLMLYLAVNYLDRFLSSQGLESTKPPWASKLIAASCLSLAAKMLEAELPKSLIQGNGDFMCDSRAVQRMEVVILGALGWRMRSATPFSFLSLFISLFEMNDEPSRQALRARAVRIILKAQNDVELLRFKPSIIAASSLLLASIKLFPLQSQCFRTNISACSYVNEEELMECHGSMQGTSLEGDHVSPSDEGTPDQQFSTSAWSCSTAIGNCTAMASSSSASTSSSSSSSSPSSIKRRKISLWSKSQFLQQSFRSLSDSKQ